jgi:Fe-S cluster assembly iron-binding protein IscA
VLTITDRAVSTIRTLTDQPDLPDGTGLRIAADQSSGALNVSLRTGPAEDDEVLAFDETLVFLEHMAAEQLDDKTMDADIDADGQVRFTIADQMP